MSNFLSPVRRSGQNPLIVVAPTQFGRFVKTGSVLKYWKKVALATVLVAEDINHSDWFARRYILFPEIPRNAGAIRCIRFPDRPTVTAPDTVATIGSTQRKTSIVIQGLIRQESQNTFQRVYPISSGLARIVFLLCLAQRPSCLRCLGYLPSPDILPRPFCIPNPSLLSSSPLLQSAAVERMGARLKCAAPPAMDYSPGRFRLQGWRCSPSRPLPMLSLWEQGWFWLGASLILPIGSWS